MSNLEKIIGSIAMTISVGTLSFIICGSASYLLGSILKNEEIFEIGAYIGTTLAIAGGIALSYMAYREY
jgi:hypothetical protein